LGYETRLARDESIMYLHLIRDSSSKREDRDDEENNAQGPRPRASPASQDPEEEAGAVLKNPVY
jgi:hypothetical protein